MSNLSDIINGIIKATGINFGNSSLTRFIDWTNFSPGWHSTGGTVSFTSNVARYKVINKTLFLMMNASANHSGANGEYRFYLPGGYTAKNAGNFASGYATNSGSTPGWLMVVPTYGVGSDRISCDFQGGFFSAGNPNDIQFCGCLEIE